MLTRIMLPLGLALSALSTGARTQEPGFRLTIDSAHREAVIRLGPYHVPSDSGMDMSTMMDMGDIMSPRFIWPMNVLVRSYELRILDSTGRLLPRRLLHHYGMMDWDRRELVYPVMFHAFAGGAESGDFALPTTVGVPFVAGNRMAFYFMWRNEGGRVYDGVFIEARLRWIPENQVPRPTPALPFFVDVNYHPGGASEFDDPPGGCTRTYAFTLGTSGRLLGLGAHLHQWGSSVRLEDAETGKVIGRMEARRDADGEVVSVSRKLYGVFGEGPHLEGGHRYLLVVSYDNPTRDTVHGVMGYLGGLFVPDDLRKWPVIDTANAEYLKDLHGWESGLPGGSTVAAVR